MSACVVALGVWDACVVRAMYRVLRVRCGNTDGDDGKGERHLFQSSLRRYLGVLI